jgi:quinol monooxygenase YgiN
MTTMSAATERPEGADAGFREPPTTDPDGFVIVTMVFDAAADATEQLAGLLSRYVVVSRGHPGCRNIDLAASTQVPGRYVVVQKWESPDAQRRHFDSDDLVGLARDCNGLLARPPQIDLLEPISAHDLH